MKLEKLTTLLVVDKIEPCLPQWDALGYKLSVRVPDKGPLGFVILASGKRELMLQTKASLAADLPLVAKRKPKAFLYAHVESLAEAKRALRGVEVLVPKRTTFYGATECWVVLTDGTVLGLSGPD